jgi:hypothetical protein
MRVLLFVLFAGCNPHYYVADVHSAGGQLVQTKCEFGNHGRPTDDCHEEPVKDASVPPGPTEPTRQIDAAVLGARPAPNEATMPKR